MQLLYIGMISVLSVAKQQRKRWQKRINHILKLLLSLNSQKRLGYKENNTKYSFFSRDVMYISKCKITMKQFSYQKYYLLYLSFTDMYLPFDNVYLSFNCADLRFNCVDLLFNCVYLSCNYVYLPFNCVDLPFNCVYLTFNYVLIIQ